MRSRRSTRRLLGVGAALALAVPALVVSRPGTSLAAGCPPPAASTVSTAPATAPRTVALTFDDGPGPFTPLILKVLRENGVRATFFDTGAHDAAFPAFTGSITADGNLLEDHSWDHLYPADVAGGWTTAYVQDQISRTAAQQTALTGQSICWFRPPGGYLTNVLTATHGLGLSVELWSTDTSDWKQPGFVSTAAVDAIVAAGTATGGQQHPVVLMHASKASHEPDSQVSPFRGNTVAALPAIIAWYRANGYQFVDLAGGSGLRGRNTDFSGDQLGDVLATRPDGSLWAYLGNGASGWRSASPVGTGWQGVDAMTSAGDFAGNGHPALVYRQRADGSLWMYPTDGAGGWGPGRQIGTGWNVCSAIFSPGDFDSDGHPDLMCLRADDGTLWLYPGNGAGGFRTPSRVGTGFAGYERITGPGDVDGDGYPDVLAVAPDGSLVLFSGNGFGGWRSQRQVGTGWQDLPRMFSAGDLSGDGWPDVLGQRSDGTLQLYVGDGTGGWSGPQQVGTGWNALSLVAGMG